MSAVEVETPVEWPADDLHALADVLIEFPSITDEPTSELRLGYALGYADQGMHVLPLHWPNGDVCSCERHDCDSPAKHPLLQRGLNEASKDPDVILGWWRRWPSANVGVRTGTVSDLAVLDVDGFQAEASLKHLPGELPPTWVSITGRPGGSQLWFRFPSFKLQNSGGDAGWLGKRFPKLDVRANGGYCVAPPSRHISGSIYRWEGNRPARAPWPAWLSRELIEPKPSKTAGVQVSIVSPDRYAQAALDGEAAGLAAMPADSGRNAKLNAAVYQLRVRFVDPEKMSAKQLVDTMYSAAIASGLSDVETRRTIRSAMRAP